jgi:hypothetical protein
MDDHRRQNIPDTPESESMKPSTLKWIALILGLLFMHWLVFIVSYGFIPLYLLYIGLIVYMIYKKFAK